MPILVPDDLTFLIYIERLQSLLESKDFVKDILGIKIVRENEDDAIGSHHQLIISCSTESLIGESLSFPRPQPYKNATAGTHL